MSPASKAAMCGMCTALSVLLLFLGGVLTVFSYICPMITGILMIALVSTFGFSSAWITYFATSVLSFFLVPDKECMLMYVLFFGYYTIIRLFIEKIKFSALRLVIKLIIFNAALVGVNVLLFYAFGIPFQSAGDGKAFLIIFWIIMNILFQLYEKLLGLMTVLYKKKIEIRLRKIMKK